MRRLRMFLLAGVVFFLSFSCLVTAQDVPQADPAQDQLIVIATESWLGQVDQKDYEASWTNASAYFKSMVAKDQWLVQLGAVRNPLGNTISRTLWQKQRLAALPGAPDGEYCVLTFNTVFANKSGAVETITMSKENDGQWRVIGYFIK